jgi:sugar O-acyltransferase (sialic acid O-acetyltransferase NeuD family)
MATLYLCGAGNAEGVRLALTINGKASRWERIVLLDDDPQKHGRLILGVEVVGTLNVLSRVNSRTAEVANLVARTAARRWSLRKKLEAYGLPFATLIHPDVEVSGVTFGRDIIVYQNANIGPEVSIREGSVVFMGAAVGHESRLDYGCIIAPHAVVNARVELGDGVYVGSNAAILPEVKVGPWATIGACTVAMRNVPAGATLLGVPGKIVCKLRQPPIEAIPPEALMEPVSAQTGTEPPRATGTNELALLTRRNDKVAGAYDSHQ